MAIGAGWRAVLPAAIVLAEFNLATLVLPAMGYGQNEARTLGRMIAQPAQAAQANATSWKAEPLTTERLDAGEWIDEAERIEQAGVAGAQGTAEPTNAEQVIARYKQAIGAERFASITTFEERGEMYGNVTNFWLGSGSPRQSQNKERGAFEFYFKAPNLRFSSRVNDQNQVVWLNGCDGKVSWYVDAFLRRVESKPKPGNEYDCKAGFERMPSFIDEPKAKVRLTKKKEVEGRMAWEMRVELPKAAGSETFYFDTETYLLLRMTGAGFSITYSDYREVGGIKFPFVMTMEATNSRQVTTIREMKINSPIEDMRFVEPQVKGKRLEVSAAAVSGASGQQSEVSQTNSEVGTTPPKPESGLHGAAASLSGEPSRSDGAQRSASEVNFPNFTACTLGELQLAVPELGRLKGAPDQKRLGELLDKVGEKTVDMARHTPDLISLETVAESQAGGPEASRDYDYLILRRVEGNEVGLNEFRVDRKTGDRYQTDEAMKEPSMADMERASHELAGSPPGRAPISQGFANSWVHFYPRSRGQASFRYLGEQKMNGQRTLVVAFAEKRESVPTPSLFRAKEKMVPMFLQGVAWVSAADFRILRLRTDLLSPLPEVSLHRLTTETQFVAVRIQGVDSALWLPRDVMVTAEVQGTTIREDHTYSNYRLFRAKSKVVLN